MNPPTAKLSELIEGMDMVLDEYAACYDRETGKIVTVPSSALEAAQDGAEEYEDPISGSDDDVFEVAREIAADDRGRFVPGPDKFDFHEYRHMEHFIGSLDDNKAANRLSQAIRGSGAFRRFKDTLHNLGIQDAWYRYRTMWRRSSSSSGPRRTRLNSWTIPGNHPVSRPPDVTLRLDLSSTIGPFSSRPTAARRGDETVHRPVSLIHVRAGPAARGTQLELPSGSTGNAVSME
jgi:hypothetical protein